MNHKGVMLGVEDPVELAEGGVKIQGLEGVVGGGFHRVICIHFPLNRNN